MLYIFCLASLEKMLMEEGYSQLEMEITVCVTEVGPEAHKPVSGSKLCTDKTSNIMTVLHTTLLGPTCTLCQAAIQLS